MSSLTDNLFIANFGGGNARTHKGLMLVIIFHYLEHNITDDALESASSLHVITNPSKEIFEIKELNLSNIYMMNIPINLDNNEIGDHTMKLFATHLYTISNLESINLCIYILYIFLKY